MLQFVPQRFSIPVMLIHSRLVASLLLVLLSQTLAMGKTIVMKTHVRNATVRVSTAKLRNAPTEAGRTLGLLDHKASMSVLSVKSGWVHVQTKRGTKGWIRRDLVDLKTSVVVTSKKVKIAVTKPNVVRKSVDAIPIVRKTAVHPATQTTRPAQNQRIAVVEAGHLPEAVTTVESTKDPVTIDDPIAEKRSSVVGFAQDVITSSKPSNPVRSTLMSRANSQRGTPYRFGSSGGGTFDCSGFTSAMYRKVGVRLPRTAAEQFGAGIRVAKNDLVKGDLVFFRNTAGRRGISHVGIYSGGGKFIHASSRGHAVRVDTLMTGYYSSHFAGGRRLLR